jgi:uncharacterized cupredoxin-like copper-binding protein
MVHKRGLARLIAICALAASVMLVLAACGASTSGGYEAGSTPKESSGGGSSGGSGNITVTEKEFSITPNKVSAPAGNITFTIKNTGSVAHDIAVNVNGTEKASPLVQPGKTETWSVTIDTAGTYDMYCSVPGHKEAGMDGSLEVTGAGSTGGSSASSGSGSNSGGASTVSVSEKEFAITPADVTASPGKITFQIKNTGSVAHDITVDVNGTPQSSPLVQPGKSETWSVTIDKPGTYDMYCSVPGHKEAGMNGSLKVGS